MMRSATNPKASGKENASTSKKNRINDRRGVSEIKRSEAALHERNNQLVFELQQLKSLSTEATKEREAMAIQLANLESQQIKLQGEMLNADEQHISELHSQRTELMSEMEIEKEKLQRRIEAMSGALESLGHDPVTMEVQLARKDHETAEILDDINLLVEDIDTSTSTQQETCSRILEDLEDMFGHSAGECPSKTTDGCSESPDIY
eukprot:m.52454 g.52454  ORF g.52454 m.52454 type:complete len:206 (+) comp15410_c0_seq1:135-752(+)